MRGEVMSWLVLLAVGREGHSAVEKHFDVGPHLFKVLLARQFHDPCQHGEHPRGHSAQVGDVLVERLAGYAVALHLEVVEQRGLLLGHSHEVYQGVDVLYEDGAQVAHEAAGDVVVGRVAAAEDEPLAVEHSAFGVVAEVQGHRVAAALVVGVLQPFAAYGYELALVVGGTR